VALHIRDDELPGTSESRTFLGRDHGEVPVSFFIQASPPGHGPGPHRHPYAEVFVLHEGSGSFLAGVNGAQPGVYVQARPQIGRWFRQEWYQGQAEDRFRALGTSAPVAVRYGRFRHALRTEERTDLEPGVVDNKYYVRGLGVVRELTVRGGTEILQLADVLR